MLKPIVFAGIIAGLIGLSGSPSVAQTDSGEFLAGRAAERSGDFEAAARYYGRALLFDPTNPALLHGALAAYLRLGNVEMAAEFAGHMRDLEMQSQVAQMALTATYAADGDFQAVFSDLEAGHSIGGLVDGLLQAWGYLGLGETEKAMAAFDEMAARDGLRSFVLYHKAMAFAMVGDYGAAAELYSRPASEGIQPSRRGTITFAEVLSQLDRNDEAVAVIDAVFGDNLDRGLAEMRQFLIAGATLPISTVRTPAEGYAEVFLTVAGVVRGNAEDDFTLLYSRIAEHLKPQDVDPMLFSAELLEDMGNFEAARATYDRVPRSDPSFHIAELGRADALRQLDRVDAAIEVLQQLVETHGELPLVHLRLGDLYRWEDQPAASNEAYTNAIALSSDDTVGLWATYFKRGVTFEKMDDWTSAEADFRHALELSPGQPQVLNHLGYGLVEQDRNLDEALTLIEAAVAANPDSGYIVDSLGWVLYRLGRYDEAVGQMERATELEPVNAVINDHLGDVYWAVGRVTEARFQWRRALNLDPEPEEALRIERKLQIGLDAVLLEEGRDPLQIANDGARDDG